MHLARSVLISCAAVTGTNAFDRRQANSSIGVNNNTGTASDPSYWLVDIKHQGVAPYSSNDYQVFRSVKDFGAKGDGTSDDTAAINLAISTGSRCAPGSCNSSTTTPALIYFPAGTYLISAPIIDYYYTQLIGNPNSLPTLKGSSNFSGIALIDGDPYKANGDLSWGSTNVFFRQVRNLVFDTTSVPANVSVSGIHWPTAQATSLQNCIFNLNSANGTTHQGIFIESGSGGFMNDLMFNGGYIGAWFGNQQFTVRNLTFQGMTTAILQNWDWGWTYMDIKISNCKYGVNMSNNIPGKGQSVGSVTFLDSIISNTDVAFWTARNSTSLPVSGGSLIIDNVVFQNVGVGVQNLEGSVLAGGSMTVSGWGTGNAYVPSGPIHLADDFIHWGPRDESVPIGPVQFADNIAPLARPASLTVEGNKYYSRSKPQYENLPVSQFMSVRDAGAKGDGKTDDYAIIQQTIITAAAQGRVVFFDQGLYVVSNTLYIPPGSKIVGEAYPVILGTGTAFASMSNPVAVVMVGRPGETGEVEWSDMIVSTQGANPGAILIAWNLVSCPEPSGMWDVHTRIGGFAGTDLQLSQCPTNSSNNMTVNSDCIAAFMSMHVSGGGSKLYMENVWLWTADHDIEDPNLTQISIFTGRGLYIESDSGPIWLVGTAVEHNALYQYQFANIQNLFAGQVQTETAYYQPNPNTTLPFSPLPQWKDPDFVADCQGVPGNCADGWGMRIIDSEDILIYGMGLYSFFNNYNTTCSQVENENCQQRIFSIEGSSSNIGIYNLNTVGSQEMVTRDGKSLAEYAYNVNTFADTIALFQSG